MPDAHFALPKLIDLGKVVPLDEHRPPADAKTTMPFATLDGHGSVQRRRMETRRM
jgi:hypothetical protein